MCCPRLFLLMVERSFLATTSQLLGSLLDQFPILIMNLHKPSQNKRTQFERKQDQSILQEIRHESLANATLKRRLQTQIHSLPKFAQLFANKLHRQSSINHQLTSISSELQMQMAQKEHSVRRGEEQAIDLEIEALKRKKLKLQYDIERITRKLNTSLAEINGLKLQVNQARSERVVCSSIFKKLQKQIKAYQELYKGLILQTLLIDRRILQLCEQSELNSQDKSQVQSPCTLSTNREQLPLKLPLAGSKLSLLLQKKHQEKPSSENPTVTETADLSFIFDKLKLETGIDTALFVQMLGPIDRVNQSLYHSLSLLHDSSAQLETHFKALSHKLNLMRSTNQAKIIKNKGQNPEKSKNLHKKLSEEIEEKKGQVQSKCEQALQMCSNKRLQIDQRQLKQALAQKDFKTFLEIIQEKLKTSMVSQQILKIKNNRDLFRKSMQSNLNTILQKSSKARQGERLMEKGEFIDSGNFQILRFTQEKRQSNKKHFK